MRCHRRFLSVGVLGFLCACSGGSTGTTSAVPQTSSVNAPAGDNARSVQLGAQPASAALPVVSHITGTLLFPAVRTPAIIALSASATAPAGVAGLKSMRYAQSGSLTVYEYFTIVSPVSVTLPSLPAITLNFPVSIPLAGKSVYYGVSDLNAQGGRLSFNTQGPGTKSGQTVSFAQVPTPITFAAGHTYTFALYATARKDGASTIYVLNSFNTLNTFNTENTATYNVDGTRTTPTIAGGLAVAVDTAGKIYLANFNDGSPYAVTTYEANGTRTTPTIDLGGFFPSGVAVDAAGKIYVLNGGGYDTVATFNADGTRTTPTITAGVNDPEGVAVDAAGKIYVSNAGSNTVTTYNADGTQTTPTITSGLSNSSGVAVDAAGKIYVSNADSNTVTTYNADGTRTTPTITAWLGVPFGVAVDAAGKIYVANLAGNNVTTYNPDGTLTTPTITAGITSPRGIAVR
jgi:sugar lactone lactonase YvrE